MEWLRRNAMNEQFKQFFAEATDAFQFLEEVYEYRQLEDILESPDDMRDTWARLRYVGPRVGVEIMWDFANANIGVNLVELLKEKVFPRSYSLFQDGLYRPDTARAVNLEILVEVLGQKEKADFLLSYPRRNRRHNERLKLIEKKRQEIIVGLAHATHTSAATILQGDTTIFPLVMKRARHRL
jgi:hypothetical protein